jgi:hypothetical protein
MGVIGGAAGMVNGATGIQNWSISSSENLNAIVASNTGGGTVRIAGPGDWSGRYNAVGGLPASLPGAALSFVGSIEGTKGVAGTAIVTQCVIRWDWTTGDAIKHEVSFDSNGALAYGAAVATDSSVIDPLPTWSGKLEYATPVAVPSFSEASEVRTATLTLRCANPAYVNSGTSQGTRRLKGPRDFDLSVDVHTDEDIAGAFADVGETLHIRLYTDSTDYWDLKWAVFGEHSNIEVNVETHEVVGLTMNSSMNNETDIGGTPTLGAVTKPGGGAWT